MSIYRSRPILAVSSAVVSRLAAFGALIAAARVLEPVEFGVFAVLTAVVGVVNAIVSGGGDMWLNSFTGTDTRQSRRVPRISHAYLVICGSLAVVVFMGMGIIFGVSASETILGSLDRPPRNSPSS